MQFKVLYPYPRVIESDSFKEAIKNYIKINHEYNINRLIIADQMKKRQAFIDYYSRKGINKANINISPFFGPVPTPLAYPNFLVAPINQNPNQVTIEVNTNQPLTSQPVTNQTQTKKFQELTIDSAQPNELTLTNNQSIILNKSNPNAIISFSAN